MSYSKLHQSIVNSSLWVAPDSTRILFITLLAMADKDGMIYGSRQGLTRIANIDPGDMENAWHELLSPDPDSSDRIRAPENEGRRIEEVSGGFRLLNFDYYRGLRNEDERREQNRAAQERHRAKLSLGQPPSAAVSHGQPSVSNGHSASPSSAHTDTDTEAVKPSAHRKRCAGGLFDRFWSMYPRKVSKGAAERAFQTINPDEQLVGRMCAAIERAKTSEQWRKDGGQFIPHASTWLRAKGWEDEPAAQQAPQDREWLRKVA